MRLVLPICLAEAFAFVFSNIGFQNNITQVENVSLSYNIFILYDDIDSMYLFITYIKR